MPYGATIAQGLTEAVRNGVLALDDVPLVAIYIDGERLDRDTALDFVPADGQVVNVVVEPQGGDTGKAIFQLFYTIGAAIVSFYFGPIWGAVVTIAGNVITNAIWAPERDSMADGRGRSALQGGGNAQRLRQMMPLALGRQRVAFDQAGLPISDNVGPDVWLTIPLAAHYGPCTVEDIKIGETLLSDYPASDYQLETFLTPGPRASRLYPSRIVQDNYQDKLDFTGGGVWEVQAAVAGAARLSVDITLPSGLKYNADSGKVRNEEVTGRVEFAEVGTENWQPVPTITGYRNKNNQPLPVGTWYLNLKTNDAVRRTFIWDAPDPAKQYKVRVKAWDSDGDFPNSDGRVWDTYWTALRSIFDQRAFVDEQLSILVLRIKSSDDLNGNLPPVTGVVTPICPVWRNGNWNTSEPTSNAAALLRWIMTGPAPATPLLPSEIDASLADQYDLIEARNWHGAYWLDRDTTQEEAIIALGRMGRFSAYWNGERLCVVPDWGKPVARQLFTERNIEGYRYQRQLPEPIHAVLVEFRNLDEDSRGDEVWVYADGYDATTAENFISVTIDFACTKTRAFIEGRVYLAKYELMVETHEWTTFGESLVATFGDRVRIRHSVGLIGAGEGRVQFCRRAGAMITGVRLDDPVTMQAGRTYAIDVRCGEDPADGMLMGLEVVTEPGTTRDLVFPTPLAPTAAPRANDLVAFGERGLVTEDVEIVDIVPSPDGTAKIVAVPYLAAEIEAAETGPVPELPTTLEPVQPTPTPRWVGTPEGDPTGARAAFDINPARADQVASFVVRIQRQGDDGLWSDWAALSTLPATARQVTTPPFPDAARQPGDDQPDYVVRLDIRAIMSSGEVSRRAVSAPIVISKGVREPQNVFANGVVRTDASGASYPALHIACDPVAAGGVQDLQVEVRTFGSTAPDWRSAGQPLPAANPAGDLLDVQGGETVDVRVRWRTADNWYSAWVVTQDPVLIPDERVSSDTVNVGGTPAADLLANLASVEALAAQTAEAVGVIEGDYQTIIDAKDAAVEAATSASGSADAAAVQATLATTAASDAGDAATAALASQVAAKNHSDDAAAAAATAVTQAAAAEGYASASAAQATNAATSAGQALTYSNQASSSAADANAASVTAGVAASTAQLTSAKMMPDRVSDAANFFNVDAWATPDATTPLTEGVNVSTPDQGAVRQFTGSVPIASRGWRKVEPGRTYRFTSVSKVVSGAPGNQVRNGFGLYDTNGAPVGWWLAFPDRSNATDWITDQREVSGDFLLSTWPNAVYFRPLIHSGLMSDGTALPSVTWAVSTLRAEDVTESASAANSAAVAQSASASASASAASAQISADLAAKVGLKPNRVVNSDFSNGLANWTPYGGWSTYIHAMFGPLVHSTAGGDVYLVSDWVRVEGGETYTCSAVGDQGPGANAGGMYFRYRRGDGSEISDGNTFTPTQGIGWQSRIKATFTVPSDCVFVEVIFFRSAAHSYPLHISRVMFSYGTDLVPWNNDAQEAVVSSQLQINAAATADLSTRMASASFEVTAAVGGNPAYLGIKADSSGSWAGLKAQALAFSNVIGGTVVEVMKIIGGAVYITGPLYIGSNKEIELNPISTHPHIAIKVGGGRIAMGRLPNDGLIYWFGPSQEVTDMRKSNGTEWRDNTGQAYFKGGISTGTLQASARTSDQNVPTTATTGRFGSLGKTITVNFNYDAEAYVSSVSYTPPFPPSFEDISPASAVIRLHRSINGGPFEAVASITVPGQVRNWGQNDGDSYSEGININCGGAGTYTDPDLSTLDRQYRVELVSRSFSWLNGPNNYRRQMLSVVCSEA